MLFEVDCGAGVSLPLRQTALLPLLSSANDERSHHVMGDLKTLNLLALLGCARVFEKLSHAL
jgi:hypothetical protein